MFPVSLTGNMAHFLPYLLAIRMPCHFTGHLSSYSRCHNCGRNRS